MDQLVKLGAAFEKISGVRVKNINLLEHIRYGKKPGDVMFVNQESNKPHGIILRLRVNTSLGARIVVIMERQLTLDEVHQSLTLFNNPPKPEPKSQAMNDANLVGNSHSFDSSSEPEHVVPVAPAPVTTTPAPAPVLSTPAPESPAPQIASETSAGSTASADAPASDEVEAGGRTDSEVRGFYSLLLEQNLHHPVKLPVDTISTLVRSLFDDMTGRGDIGNFYRAYVVPFAMKISGDEEAWSFDWTLVQSYVHGAARPQKSLRDVRMRLHVPANTAAPSSGSSVLDFAQRVKLSKQRPAILAEINEMDILGNEMGKRHVELVQLIGKLQSEQHELEAKQQQLSVERESLAAKLQQATLSAEDQATLEEIKAALA